MLLFTCEQFYLNFIQVQLQCGQSFFPTGAPTDVSQFCKTGSRNVDRILSDLTARKGQSIGHCQNRSEGRRDVARTAASPGG